MSETFDEDSDCDCKNGAGERNYSAHTCPFKTEVNEDFDSLCRCCESCEEQCRMDT